MNINWADKLARKGHEIFLSGLPVALHCHHYNMNLQKTLESSLGSDGAKIIYQAAEESSYSGFTSFLMHHPRINTTKSKLELASTSYQYCGLGIINLAGIDENGGRVVSTHSHHVTGWLAKFGRRTTPGCFFTMGWLAGVLAVIFDKHLGYYKVEEHDCKMAMARECVFEIKRT